MERAAVEGAARIQLIKTGSSEKGRMIFMEHFHLCKNNVLKLVRSGKEKIVCARERNH